MHDIRSKMIIQQTWIVEVKGNVAFKIVNVMDQRTVTHRGPDNGGRCNPNDTVIENNNCSYAKWGGGGGSCEDDGCCHNETRLSCETPDPTTEPQPHREVIDWVDNSQPHGQSLNYTRNAQPFGSLRPPYPPSNPYEWDTIANTDKDATFQPLFVLKPGSNLSASQCRHPVFRHRLDLPDKL